MDSDPFLCAMAKHFTLPKSLTKNDSGAFSQQPGCAMPGDGCTPGCLGYADS
jgi:hypothetical protein